MKTYWETAHLAEGEGSVDKRANTAFEEANEPRYSAKSTVKPVNFYCDAPVAKTVCLVGDFNTWNSASHPMSRRVDGWWFVQVRLSHGHHHYLFLVDGKPALDPRATGVARNEKDERVSVVAVS